MNKKMFNINADTIEEALEYMKNRSYQLLKYNIYATDVKVTNFGVVVDYVENGKAEELIGVYILKKYRGRGILQKIMSKTNKTFINIFDNNNLIGYLIDKKISHKTIGIFHKDINYIRAKDYLASSRSLHGFDINKVEEQLAIMEWTHSSHISKQAICLAAKLLSDSDLIMNWKSLDVSTDATVVLLAMEFRSILSRYDISIMRGDNLEFMKNINNSEILEVNQMLSAYIMQNYNYFELFIKDKHPRSGLIESYYKIWLEKLDCEAAYKAICKDRLRTIKVFDKYVKENANMVG